MRDRYSIVVGLLFARDDRDRHAQHARRRRRRRDARARPPAGPLAAAGVRRARAPRASSKATPTSPRTTARPPQLPCPEDARRTPACRIRAAGAIRVCDLFDRPLVISFWFTKGGDCVDQQDVVDAVYAALPWTGELPLAGRARRPRHGSRPGPRARLADAGRLRPRRRRRQPLPGRRLPDLRLRLPGRHPAERQHRRPRRRPARATGSSGCCGATAAAEAS